MSVAEFERALATATSPRFAVVSQALFFALDNLGKIFVKQITRPVPGNPIHIGSVSEFFRNYRKKPNDALVITYFVLSEYPEVNLSSVTLHPTLRLDDLGANSFKLYGD